MSEPNAEQLAEVAFKKLAEGDPREARKILMQAAELAPERPDILNALGVCQLQLGESHLALPLFAEAVSRADMLVIQRPAERDQLEAMRDGIRLSLAAAHEDLDQPDEAESAYRQVLSDTPGQPRARQGLAHLLLARGELRTGVQQLRTYVEEDRDENPFLEGAKAFADDVERFQKEDIDPGEIIVAHREAYCEMFDSYAGEQAKLGWIAEAGRMRRGPTGQPVPIIPDGARPYAAVRVDLVNPQTSEIGQVGDQPYVVALAEYQSLARAPVAFPLRGYPFDVRISTQTPWDQLPIQLHFALDGALDAADLVVGDWYTAGFNGTYGTADGHRFHYISDPEAKRNFRAVTYDVDMGRSKIEAVHDLLRRLTVLHDAHPLVRVHVGRGYL